MSRRYRTPSFALSHFRAANWCFWCRRENWRKCHVWTGAEVNKIDFVDWIHNERKERRINGGEPLRIRPFHLPRNEIDTGVRTGPRRGWYPGTAFSQMLKKNPMFSRPSKQSSFVFLFLVIGVHEQLFFQRAPASAWVRLFCGGFSRGSLFPPGSKQYLFFMLFWVWKAARAL